MPTFCRHNHLIQNCPICSREQSIELRPVLSSSAPKTTQPREATPRVSRRPSSGGRPAAGMKVRKLARDADDGYRCALVPGLRSSAEAERLAEELAFAAGRLLTLRERPPGLWAEVASGTDDLEERTWLAFLIAYLSPLNDDAPFSAIQRARTSWRSAEEVALTDANLGPRTAHDPSRGSQTLTAYRAWAERAGSQANALSGDLSWAPERRFERVFERLALPGLHRDARFELLTTLGWLGLYELRAGKLFLGGENEVTLAAKRVFGIGDSLLLDRRAEELASAGEIPLESLDLALFNWSRRLDENDGQRYGAGLEPDTEAPGELPEAVRGALAL